MCILINYSTVQLFQKYQVATIVCNNSINIIYYITIKYAKFFINTCVLNIAVFDSRIIIGYKHFLEKLNGNRAFTHTAVTDHHQLVCRQWMVGGLGYGAPMTGQLLLCRVGEPRRQFVYKTEGIVRYLDHRGYVSSTFLIPILPESESDLRY